MQYLVQIDTANDGTFATTITDDVVALEWRLGMRRPYDDCAAPGIARITVRNADQAYSTLVGGVLGLGRQVRLRIDDGVDTATFFVGMIDTVEPAAGEYGERTAVITVTSAEREFDLTPVLLPLQVNVLTSTALTAILSRAPLNRFPRVLQTGTVTLSYVGDTWGDGIPAARAIRQIVGAERGRFYTDRLGRLIFLNRSYLQTGPTLATFTDTAADLRYRAGDLVVNQVEVRIVPRTLGAANSTVWTLDKAQLIKPGADGEREIIARLRDPQGRFVGLVTLVPPVAGTDYTANTAADGTGTNVTASLQVTVLEVNGSAVRLRLRNTSAANLYLLPGARLRGTPITRSDPLTVVAAGNAGLIAAQGIRPLRLSLPALDSIDAADSLARFELIRRSQVYESVRTITFDHRTLLPQALGLTLFDRIRIVESQTGHDGTYLIISEAHTVGQGGASHRVTFTLEPVNTIIG